MIKMEKKRIKTKPKKLKIIEEKKKSNFWSCFFVMLLLSYTIVIILLFFIALVHAIKNPNLSGLSLSSFEVGYMLIITITLISAFVANYFIKEERVEKVEKIVEIEEVGK